MNANRIMALAFLAIVLVLVLTSLTGCAKPERSEPILVTKEVKVPVAEVSAAPVEMLRTPLSTSDLPLFVAPTSPQATSCLTPEGEAKFRSLSDDRESRLDAWEKWGVLP